MNTTTERNTTTAEVDALNCLLRCELAAVDTYDRAMQRFDDSRLLADLQTIRQEHIAAENMLRQKVVQVGGEPIESSEPWGACSAAIAGAPTVIGPATALAALRQGEEHTINEFEDALKHENVNSEFKNLIRTNLLPIGRKHVAELDRLMGGMI